MIALAFLLLFHGQAHASVDGELAWWKASSPELAVEGRTMIDSGTNSEEWSKLIRSGVDPFGRGNEHFELKIRDKMRSTTAVVPMVPVSFVGISDSSRFIVVLSSADPTYGIVVVSRSGELVFTDFGICFSNQCPVMSHDEMPWFDDVDVGVSFESTADGIDCIVRLKEDKAIPGSPELAFDVCKKQRLPN